MKQSIYFIRHGQKETPLTFNSIANKKPDITKEGRQQASCVGKYLKIQNLQQVYSSDYIRALNTAKVANESLQLDICVDASFGERVLLTVDVDAPTSKREFLKSQRDWSYRSEGGESLNDVIKRFTHAVGDATENPSSKTIAVFTHGRALQTYLSHIFPGEGFECVDLIIDPCDVYRVDYDNGLPSSWSFVFAPFMKHPTNNKIATLADTMVAKVPDENKIEKTHLFNSIGHNIQANLYEKESLDLLNSLGVPVPGSRSYVGQGKYISMSYISGDTLGDLLANNVNTQSNLRKAGQLLRDFHRKVDRSQYDGVALQVKRPNPELNAQCALNFVKLTAKHVHEKGGDPIYELFIDTVKDAKRVVQNNPHYLDSHKIIYGDFKPDNVLISNQNIYMVDPHLSYGRFSCDLGKMIARLYLIDPAGAAKNVVALLDGYKPDAYMLREIRHMAGFDILNTFSRLMAKKQMSPNINIPSHRSTLKNMKKCLSDIIPALFKNGDILILRHFDDVQDFRVHYRNTPLISGEERKASESAQSILNECRAKDKKKIHLISSKQIRAIETARLVAAKLRGSVGDIEVKITLDSRIRDLYHGSYVIPKDYKVGVKLPALSLATKAYTDQTFTHKNIDYKNGDPLDGLYPDLVGLFAEYGETQRSFSVRFYDFLSSFIESVDSQHDTLFVVVAHTAIVFRLFEMYHLVKELAANQKEIAVGDLSFYEWQQAIHLDRDPNNQLFIEPGEIKSLELGDLLGYSWRLRGEVSYLRKHAN